MKILKSILIVFCLYLFLLPSEAKKIKNRFSITKEKPERVNSNYKAEIPGEEILIEDSIIAKYGKNIISFAGYEKEANSRKETFLLQNASETDFIGYSVRIDYLDMQGRMLHSRTITDKCNVPSGETRKIDINTWDNQFTYYYYLGNEPKKVATPYKVIFKPLSVWIDK